MIRTARLRLVPATPAHCAADLESPTALSKALGVAIAPSWPPELYEAVDGLLSHAFADARVTRVIAHTLVELEPSIAVLRSAGFSFVGQGDDPQEPSAIQYEITRASFERRPH